MKVLIAIDGSEYSQAAVEDVKARTWWGDTEFRILSVVPLLVPCMNDFTPHYAELAHIQAKEKVFTVELVEQTANDLKKAIPFATISKEVKEGNVCDSIVQVSDQWGADLIVLGSHGRSGLSHMLLGSVAETVLANAHCSVEIIKGAPILARLKEKRAKAAVSQV